MIDINILMLIGVGQILLSVYLIFKLKNKMAIISEILTSLLLFCALNKFIVDINNISWNFIFATLVEYVFVKVFLIIFMWLVRVCSFYAFKRMCSKKIKMGKRKLKIINRFNRANYWPRLKLGLPAKAGKMNSKTKVRFDSKGFPKFKSYYTVKLRRRDYHKTREQHFYIANKLLYKELKSNFRLRTKFSKREITAFSNGETPSKYTWHHHQDAGVLQLVDYSVHSKTSHIGGYSIWGRIIKF